MFGKLAILIFTLALTDAGLFELSAPPKLCAVTYKVMKGAKVEKVLCYVKKEQTHFEANHACLKAGMRLYQPKSSLLAWKALGEFIKSELGGSSTAEFFVEGRKGDKCQVFRGNGKLEEILCSSSSYSVCEYFEKNSGSIATTKKIPTTPSITKRTTKRTTKTPIQSTIQSTIQTTTPSASATNIHCEAYDTNYNSDLFVDITGISSPKTCQYHSAISNGNTTLTVDSTALKEDIIVLDMANTRAIEYLPIDIATSFPNLNIIICEICGITTLSVENLQGLTKLKKLELSYNYIKILDSNVFKDLTALKKLGLVENPIASISGDFFSANFPLLDELNMNPAGCIDVSYYKDHASIILLPGSVLNNCRIT